MSTKPRRVRMEKQLHRTMNIGTETLMSELTAYVEKGCYFWTIQYIVVKERTVYKLRSSGISPGEWRTGFWPYCCTTIYFSGYETKQCYCTAVQYMEDDLQLSNCEGKVLYNATWWMNVTCCSSVHEQSVMYYHSYTRLVYIYVQELGIFYSSTVDILYLNRLFRDTIKA